MKKILPLFVLLIGCQENILARYECFPDPVDQRRIDFVKDCISIPSNPHHHCLATADSTFCTLKLVVRSDFRAAIPCELAKGEYLQACKDEGWTAPSR